MLTQQERIKVRNKTNGRHFTDSDGDSKTVSFPGDWRSRLMSSDNRGHGAVGLRGLGYCGHPSCPWPITTIIEETQDYIVCCCDAGCATILEKKSRKQKRQTKKKKELVLDISGNLSIKKRKSYEDNVME